MANYGGTGGSGLSPIASGTLLANVSGSTANPGATTRGQAAAVGLVAPDSWNEARLRAVQTIAPTLTKVSPFTTWNITSDFGTPSVNGSGTVTPDQTTDGGAILFSTGTTTGSYGILPWRDSGAVTKPVFIPNATNRPWAIVARYINNSLPTGVGTIAPIALANTAGTVDIWAGIIGGTDATKFGIWVNGVGATHFTSNLASDFGVWHNLAMVFDGTTIWLMLDDVKSSTGLTDLSNVGAGAWGNGRLICGNGTSTTDVHMTLSQLAVITRAP